MEESIITPITEFGGVELVTAYYGGSHCNKVLPQAYLIKEPAGNGYARALIMQGEKNTLIFDPFNFQGWNIANHAGELNTLPRDIAARGKDRGYTVGRGEPVERLPLDVAFWQEFLLKQWTHFSRLGMQKDWVRASTIMKALGGEVPKVITAEAAEAMAESGADMTDVIVQKAKKQRSAGKPLNAEGFKVLKRDSKRGQVCDFFLKDTPQPIVECMSTLDMSRSNVLSHLSCANRDQGWGYELLGDCVLVTVPEGVHPWVADVLD